MNFECIINNSRVGQNDGKRMGYDIGCNFKFRKEFMNKFSIEINK